MAKISDKFREEILKEEKDTNGVLFENSNTETVEFAAGFQIDGDEEPTLFWFYNCTASKPGVEAKTTSDAKEPDTDKIKISCAASSDGTVRSKTTAESYPKVKDNWFTRVYTKDMSLAE